jgi:hypothetical protein
MPSHDGLSLGERNLMAVREQFFEELIYLEPAECLELVCFLFENCTTVFDRNARCRPRAPHVHGAERNWQAACAQ